MTTGYLFNLDHAIVKDRVDYDVLLIVTTKGTSGSAWAQGQINFKLNDIECDELLCAIGEETMTQVGVKLEESDLLFFDQHSRWIKIPVIDGVVTFSLPRVFRKKAKQVTKPRFTLLFKNEEKLVAISKPFIARCRWGVNSAQTQEMLDKVRQIRSFVPNEDAIHEIDELKSSWRAKHANGPKVEKATWMQYQLVNDTRPNLRLRDRTLSYLKEPKACLEIAEEVERRLAQKCPILPPPSPLLDNVFVTIPILPSPYSPTFDQTFDEILCDLDNRPQAELSSRKRNIDLMGDAREFLCSSGELFQSFEPSPKRIKVEESCPSPIFTKAEDTSFFNFLKLEDCNIPFVDGTFFLEN
jgi:hypothetical protein